MNSDKSNRLRLKYKIPSGYKEIGIWKFKFVAKNQFFNIFERKKTQSKLNDWTLKLSSWNNEEKKTFLEPLSPQGQLMKATNLCKL